MNIKGEHRHLIHILLYKKESLLQQVTLFRLETAKTSNIVFSKQFKYSDIDPIHLF